MAASEAAGAKNREMERVSDTFHPPTTVRSHIGTVRAAA